MTPAARLQAAVEVLDEVIRSASLDGPPADILVTRYFKSRRYAGSKDRHAVRELVFAAIRRSAERPLNGRSAVVGLAEDDPSLLEGFGEPRGPQLINPEERGAKAGLVPQWLVGEMSPLVGENEWQALLERAPLDLRVNVARTSREAMISRFGAASPTPLSPWGIRLPADTRVDDSPEFEAGLVEVQDEGSQLVARACDSRDGMLIVDLCAGGGGKSLAIAAASPGAEVLAADINKARLAKLTPRAFRAGAIIHTRLLDPPMEDQQLADLLGRVDVVLIDAPCSGSGTWRRNPEGRWRLTPERLDRLVQTQERLLEIGSRLVGPGGHLVYAVCSVLRREGADQIEEFNRTRSSWIRDVVPIVGGRPDGPGQLLTPGHDCTDGFFVARLRRS